MGTGGPVTLQVDKAAIFFSKPSGTLVVFVFWMYLLVNLLVGGLEHEFYDFPFIGIPIFIIPTTTQPSFKPSFSS